MSATKLLNRWAAFVGQEATYGTNPGNANSMFDDTTTSAPDGIDLWSMILNERPDTVPQYLFDGQRPGHGGTVGQVLGVAKAGRWAEIDLVLEAYGAATTYSASVTPLGGLHDLLQSAGLTATFSTDKWVYAPAASINDFESVSLELITRFLYDSADKGERLEMNGCYSTFGFEFDGPVVPAWTFTAQGLVADQGTNQPVTEVAWPTLTVSQGNTPAGTNLPSRAVGMSLSIDDGSGAWSGAILRGASFSLEREMAGRANDNVAGGHAGFSPARRSPMLELTIEVPLLGTTTSSKLDAYNELDAGSTLAVSFQTTGAAGTPFYFSAPQAEVLDLDLADDGPTALWTLSLAPKTSTPWANDDFLIEFRAS
jgi:hypothetical protein